jgi:hemerythrin-like domain-containing protein
MSDDLRFPGFASPAAGPDAPMDMLDACHRRVEKQCRTLQRLEAYLVTHGSDADAQAAARTVLRYFDTAAIHHHADEEDNLFPAVAEQLAGATADCALLMMARLRDDHCRLGALWAVIRPVLSEVVAGTRVTFPTDIVNAFVAGYAAHIAMEDGEFFPMAARLLPAEKLSAIGAAMAERRRVRHETHDASHKT